MNVTNVKLETAATLETAISRAKDSLDAARRKGDELLIDLAEASLNNLLDTFITLIRGNK